jgi:hypothetical protein
MAGKSLEAASIMESPPCILNNRAACFAHIFRVVALHLELLHSLSKDQTYSGVWR